MSAEEDRPAVLDILLVVPSLSRHVSLSVSSRRTLNTELVWGVVLEPPLDSERTLGCHMRRLETSLASMLCCRPLSAENLSFSLDRCSSGNHASVEVSSVKVSCDGPPRVSRYVFCTRVVCELHELHESCALRAWPQSRSMLSLAGALNISVDVSPSYHCIRMGHGLAKGNHACTRRSLAHISARLLYVVCLLSASCTRLVRFPPPFCPLLRLPGDGLDLTARRLV